jgi:hypothetical protein
MIAQELLHKLFKYDPETGSLIWMARSEIDFPNPRDGWKRWNVRYAGKVAFSPNTQGYLDGMIFRKMYRAHTIVWAMHRGAWPEKHIDHINGNRTDNRIENLRDVDRAENARNTRLKSNNRSGVNGVTFRNGRWRANIRAGGHQIQIGSFDTIAEAAEARRKAEVTCGYHPNHGLPQELRG